MILCVTNLLCNTPYHAINEMTVGESGEVQSTALHEGVQWRGICQDADGIRGAAIASSLGGGKKSTSMRDFSQLKNYLTYNCM